MMKKEEDEETEVCEAVEVSVNCPECYKDAVAQDLIDFYCSSSTDRAIVICWSRVQAQFLDDSPFYKSLSLISHSNMPKQVRKKQADTFMQSRMFKCFVTTSICTHFSSKIQAQLLIFLSPPKNYLIFEDSLKMVYGVKFIAVLYSSKEVIDLERLQKNINRSFLGLDPPPIQSDEEDNGGDVLMTHSPSQVKIIVKNLPIYFTWQMLKQFFIKNSVKVKDIRVSNNIKKSKVYGFAICVDHDSFQKAKSLDGELIDDCCIRICQFVPLRAKYAKNNASSATSSCDYQALIDI